MIIEEKNKEELNDEYRSEQSNHYLEAFVRFVENNLN